LRVDGATEPRLLEASVILIATGSTPRRPSLFPLGKPGVYDADTIQQMERLPRSLAIVGGGTVGCEYAWLFKVLGLDEVRVVHSGERILPFADEEIRTILGEVMGSLGIQLHMGDAVERVEGGSPSTLHLRSGKRLETEALLVALGRSSRVGALGLENAGVPLNDTCFNYPTLCDLYKYAAYDATGRIERREVYSPRGVAAPDNRAIHGAV
jgi:NAD(P) transhydrogenase